MKLSLDTELRDVKLWEYLTENKFTDMILITGDRNINVHSAILTHFCPQVRGLIKNHFLNFEDVSISVPDSSGEETMAALEDVYFGKNCDKLTSVLGMGHILNNNDLKSEPKLEEGLERFLAGLPVKVVLKSEPDPADESEEDDVPEIDNNANDKGDDAFQNGEQKTYTSDIKCQNVSYIGHNLNYVQSLPNSSNSLKFKIVTNREKPAFKCDKCVNTFSSKALLTKHSHQVHWEAYGYSSLPNNIVVCTGNKGTCLEVFLNQELLADHRRIVHVENARLKTKSQKYQCEECGKKISSPECLRLHVDAIHRGIKHPCPHCPYSTGWPKNLDEHIMFYHTHVNDESILKYQCSICGKKFKRQNSLAEHELTHNPKTFKCFHCNRGFSHDRYLERHILSVHGDKKFPCEICGKKFTTQEYVKTHYNSVHLEHSERRHKCDICGQGFNKKMAFRSHMNKHQGLKPFLCPAPECNKCFSDDTAWSHHKRNCSHIKFNKENPPV
eukprot:GFUD01038857.1.p1 GENE.GFUD01038857.1~~GFUD01038857.1.p1  ORF type:complete len:499 (-),score=74.87 GFUD01038857.1:57-1553(-)